jgi:CHRD domain
MSEYTGSFAPLGRSTRSQQRGIAVKNSRFSARLMTWAALVLSIALSLAFAASALAVGGRPLVVSMTGAAEVPTGDPDGSGTAWFWINYGQSSLCYVLEVSGITLPATGAHIHLAPVGSPGGVVVPLTPPDATGSSSDCLTIADKGLLLDILAHPRAYYVNVHNTDYPTGAVRGQLK